MRQARDARPLYAVSEGCSPAYEESDPTSWKERSTKKGEKPPNFFKAVCYLRNPMQKVILMGGFGQSESLVAHLSNTLKKEFEGNQIRLFAPRMMSVNLTCLTFYGNICSINFYKSDAVLKGAVLRALNKSDGPDRVLYSSFGFLRSEPYGQYEEHNCQERERDKADGLDYVINTIDWVLNKVSQTFLKVR